MKLTYREWEHLIKLVQAELDAAEYQANRYCHLARVGRKGDQAKKTSALF